MVKKKKSKADEDIKQKLDSVRLDGLRAENLSIRNLYVDPSYQRETSPAKVRNIERNFNACAYGCLIVARREDGTHWIVDGQYRWKAAQSMGILRVCCRVFDSQGPEHEADVFRTINCERVVVCPYDEYRADLRANHLNALKVQEITEAWGFVVAKKKGWPKAGPVSLGCTRGLRIIQRRGCLEETLSLIMTVYRGRPKEIREEAIDRDMLEALSYIFFKCPIVDRDKLRKVLGKVRPADLRSEMTPGAKTTGGTRYIRLAEVIVRYYNKGLRTGKIAL